MATGWLIFHARRCVEDTLGQLHSRKSSDEMRHQGHTSGGHLQKQSNPYSAPLNCTTSTRWKTATIITEQATSDHDFPELSDQVYHAGQPLQDRDTTWDDHDVPTICRGRVLLRLASRCEISAKNLDYTQRSYIPQVFVHYSASFADFPIRATSFELVYTSSRTYTHRPNTAVELYSLPNQKPPADNEQELHVRQNRKHRAKQIHIIGVGQKETIPHPTKIYSRSLMLTRKQRHERKQVNISKRAHQPAKAAALDTTALEQIRGFTYIIHTITVIVLG
ncbi:hypothetical protein BJ166DRAFT_496651 [Pestalotiopsis sp. NC0098]|nr:hypothetical protein BJ166DRAFT_496651 [Pestalotiopsis sp. NC0098]